MLSMIKAALGVANLSTPIIALLAIIFAFGGAATWLREDGISDTNAKWELKLKDATLAAATETAKKQLEIERLQKTLAVKENEDAEKRKVDEAILAKQQVDFPLSPECSKCRIPNERIWVRGTQGVAGKSSTFGTKPGS